MSDRPALSRAEMEVARIVWTLREATVRQVLDNLPETRDINYKTVQTFLRRLEAKGYLVSKRDGRSLVYTADARPKQVIRDTVKNFLNNLFNGEPLGTLFLPHGEAIPSKKRWLGLTARPVGTVSVDAGAKRAMLQMGRSLLPVGVTAITGEFRKGDVVSVLDAAGTEIARGLVNYASDVAVKLTGLSNEQITIVLGSMPYAELIHRDNLVLL